MPLIRLPVSQLEQHGRGRPPGFLTAVRAEAKVEGDHLTISMADWQHLARQHRAGRKPGRGIPLPTRAQLLADYASATAEWTARHRPVLSPEACATRAAACQGCEWTALREDCHHCDHPERKCAKLFLWLPAEACRLHRWPESTANSATTMSPADYKAQLLARQTSLRDRVTTASDNVTLLEQRLAQARQRLALSQGELKAVTQVVDEQAAAAATAAEPAPAESEKQ